MKTETEPILTTDQVIDQCKTGDDIRGLLARIEQSQVKARADAPEVAHRIVSDVVHGGLESSVLPAAPNVPDKGAYDRELSRRVDELLKPAGWLVGWSWYTDTNRKATLYATVGTIDDHPVMKQLCDDTRRHRRIKARIMDVATLSALVLIVVLVAGLIADLVFHSVVLGWFASHWPVPAALGVVAGGGTLACTVLDSNYYQQVMPLAGFQLSRMPFGWTAAATHGLVRFAVPDDFKVTGEKVPLTNFGDTLAMKAVDWLKVWQNHRLSDTEVA